MKILISSGGGSGRGSTGIPWWLWVGGAGFLLLGGWRGFFKAIAGVIVAPIALVFLFAVGLSVWALVKHNFGRKTKTSRPVATTRNSKQDKSSDIIEAESKVISSE